MPEYDEQRRMDLAVAKIIDDESWDDDYYILDPVNEKSGVTIGPGFDAGQHSRKDLERMGVDKTIIDKMDPLFGVKNRDGEEAVARAMELAIPLTVDEVESLGQTVLRDKVGKFFRDFGSSAATVPEELTSELASAYYRGHFVPKHKTWELVKQRRYKDAAVEILDHDEYNRLKEVSPGSGVVSRMERTRDALLRQVPAKEEYRGGGLIRDAYGRTLF